MSDRASLLAALASVPDRLSVAVAAAPAQTAPGEWSPSDIVRHLIAVEIEVWQPRLAQLAVEDDPRWPWAEPERWTGEAGASMGDLLELYAAERAATVEHLTALDDFGWARTGTHATYGVLNVAALMTKALDHDEEHLRSLGA